MTGTMARSGGAVPARIGYLTYCSRENTEGMSGWQVVHSSPDLAAEELDALRGWVTTSFPGGDALPGFPSEEDRYQLPRRLLYARTRAAAFGYWHATPAGADVTGRPGNVFTYAVVDRYPSPDSTTSRPIEVWRSPDIPVPHGADEVRGLSTPVPGMPASGGYVTRERVADYLFDAEAATGLEVAVLLDAVNAARSGRLRGVIFGAASPDSAAMWIGGVSFLTSGTVAREISFCTLDSVAEVESTFDKGVILACVPIAQLDGLEPGPGIAVFREGEVPALGAGDEPHRTEMGSTVPVGPWSQLVLGAVDDVGSATALMDRIAELDTRCSGASQAEWPVAMIVATDETLWPGLGDVAADVLIDSSPEALGASPDDLAHASALIGSRLGTSTEEAWLQMRAADVRGQSSPIAVMVAPTYLRSALADVHWLQAHGSLPYLSESRDGQWASEQVWTELESATRRLNSSSDGPEALLTLLALVKAVVLSGLLDDTGRGPEVTTAMRVLAEKFLVPAIRDRDGEFTRLDPAGERELASVLAPAVARSEWFRTGMIGSRIGPCAAKWFGVHRLPVDGHAWDEDGRALAEVDAECTVSLLLDDPFRTEILPRRRHACRFVLPVRETNPSRYRSICTALFARAWDFRELRTTVADTGIEPAPRDVVISAIASPRDEFHHGELGELIQRSGLGATEAEWTVVDLVERRDWHETDVNVVRGWARQLDDLDDLAAQARKAGVSAYEGWFGEDIAFLTLYAMVSFAHEDRPPLPGAALDQVRHRALGTAESFSAFLARNAGYRTVSFTGHEYSYVQLLAILHVLCWRNEAIEALRPAPAVAQLATFDLQLPTDKGEPHVLPLVEYLARRAVASVSADHWADVEWRATDLAMRLAGRFDGRLPSEKAVEKAAKKALARIRPHSATLRGRMSR